MIFPRSVKKSHPLVHVGGHCARKKGWTQVKCDRRKPEDQYVAMLGKKRNLENNSKSPYYEDAKAEALGTVCQHWNCVLEF